MHKTLIALRIEGRSCSRCKDPLTVKSVDKSKLKERKFVCRSCENQRKKQKKARLKLATIQEYGGKCTCCQESNPVFLTIDHIDESGAKERKRIFGASGGTGSDFYRWLKKQGYPKDNYQILCFNCNFAKHVLGQCPHQQDK